MHNHSGIAKTNAAHRIIKEGAKPVTFTHGAHPATTHSNVVVPLLPPMPLTGNNSSTQNAAIAAALAMQTHRDNKSNIDNIEKHKRRIRELEQENEKLKNHLKESEDAIKNYRGFLSHRPNETPRIGNNGKIDMYCQTTDLNWLVSDALKIAEEKVKLLEIEKKNANNEVQVLRSRLNSATVTANASGANDQLNSSTICTPIASSTKEEEKGGLSIETPATIQEKKQLQEMIVKLQNKVNELERKASEASSVSTSSNVTTNSSNATDSKFVTNGNITTTTATTTSSTTPIASTNNNELHKHIKLLHNTIVSLKKSYLDDKETCRRLLADLNQELASSSSASNDIINKLLEKIDLLNNEITLLKNRYNDTIADRQSVEALLSDKETLLMNVNVELDMLRLKYTSINDKLSNIQVPIAPEYRHQGCDPLSPLATKTAQYQETISRLTTDIEQQKNRINEYQCRLRDASICLYKFQEIHSNEIAAVKHVAHVKDLAKVAAMRESTIEHDRVMSELKYAKDVNNVLNFALQTAEEVLQESQPHVVTKLLESRTKRMKSLEKAAIERRKEVDQRSAETCAVNTQHLEGFQLKAQEKHEGIQKEYQEMIQSLVKIFYVDDIEMKVYVDKKKKK